MPELPPSVRVNGLTYAVVTKSRTQGQDNFGLLDHMLQRIEIRHELPPAHQARTLLHECLEAIRANYALTELEHHQIELLETGLWALLQDNPGLAEVFGGRY